MIFNVLVQFGFSLPAMAQGGCDSISLDSRTVIAQKYLDDIVRLIDLSEPMIYNDICKDSRCELFTEYSKALYNVFQDLRKYNTLLDNEIELYSKNYILYLNQNVNNENVKHRINKRLLLKKGFADFSSILTDLVSITNVLQSKSLTNTSHWKTLGSLVSGLNGTLSTINLTLKTIQLDEGADAIEEFSGDSFWTDFYNAIQVPLDAINAHMDLIDAVDDVSRSSARAGVLAIIAKILNIYADYERKLMKKSIKELDNLIKTNAGFMNGAYCQIVSRRELMDNITLVMDKVVSKFYSGCAITFSITDTENPFRYDRNDTLKGIFKTSYYRDLILDYASNRNLAFKGLKCEKSKYEIVINNGVGKPFNAYMLMESQFGYKIKEYNIDRSASKGEIFELYPGIYKVDILEDIDQNSGVEISGILLEHIVIGTNENENSLNSLVLSPYGRISIEVIDKNSENQTFSLSCSNPKTNQIVHSTYGNGNKSVDLQANIPLDISVAVGFHQKKFENLTLIPGVERTLKIVYDGENFEQVKESTTNNRVEESNESVKKIYKNIIVPETYVKGTLYNSNDGDCQYNGKSLAFSIRNQKILDLRTGNYEDYVTARPGESVEVAISGSGGHLRGYLIDSSGNEVERISFWYPNKLSNNWWYSVGCSNGTMPSTNCFSGTNYNNRGSFSECKTFGEPVKQ